jgi:hypothetical protein
MHVVLCKYVSGTKNAVCMVGCVQPISTAALLPSQLKTATQLAASLIVGGDVWPGDPSNDNGRHTLNDLETRNVMHVTRH